ncbi:MAG: hypothetical protein HY046_06175 [Acidobacteria bacterium]|nr:hypothetical protein [Acidobacteriota bacterium]
MKRIWTLAAAGIAIGAMAGWAQEKKPVQTTDPATCPLHEQHMKEKNAAGSGHEHDFAAMNKRGEDAKGMGFSQSETTHHFLLQKSGGAIQVEVNDASDAANRDALRKHLQVVAESFSKGDFSIPNFVHGADPNGVKELRKLKTAVQYRYEELPNGARVVMTSKSFAGIEALHSFLRFQIYEHRTGDPLEAAK